MQIKFIDPEVVLFVCACVFFAVFFFVGRADAESVGTSLQVKAAVTAEVPCTAANSAHSVTCMDLDDEVIVVENVEVPSLWSKIVDIFRFW